MEGGRSQGEDGGQETSLDEGKCCQSPPAFFIIFTKMSWPPEYFVVCISEHAIHQNKDQSLYLKKLNLNIFFINTCMHVCMDVGRFNKKRQHFKQKSEKIVFLIKHYIWMIISRPTMIKAQMQPFATL